MPKNVDDETLRESSRQKESAPEGPLRVHVMGKGGLTTLTLPSEGTALIGRQPDAEIFIDDPAVSRRHALLHIGAVVRLEDLGSANGTRVGDQWLGRGESSVVGRGVPIEVGGWTLSLSVEGAAPKGAKIWPRAYLRACLDEEVKKAKAAHTALTLLRVRTYRALSPADASRLLGPDLRAAELVAEHAPGVYDLVLLDRALPLERELARALVQRLTDTGLDEVSLQVARLGEHGADGPALLAALDTETRAAVAEEKEGPVVSDPAMLRLYQLVDRVASGTINVLILGETGVGKELTAQRLHERSPRKAGPFIKLNCAALPDSLLESELFGYEKAAFTGADAAKPGLIEAAHGGTLFLDEVGELGITIQAKLLRVLEDRTVQRLGAIAPRSVDLRIVSATNRDLEAAAAQGRFRSDLYYRLNGIALTIPPLRERTGEIARLAQLFLARAARVEDRLALTLSLEASKLLEAHRWPGNVRELKNVIERAVILCTGNVILPEHLPNNTRPPSVVAHKAPPGPVVPAAVADARPLEQDMMAFERTRIIAALEACQGNQTKAAKMLGIARRTLINRLDEYKIERPRKRSDQDDA